VTIQEAADALRTGRVSSVELTTSALARIERHNQSLSAFITVTGDQAMVQARRADAEIASGKDRGPLHGIPVGVKDLFLTKGTRTTGGTKLHTNFVPGHDAAVVEKLMAAGAVMLGKLNLHEMAYGITSANPHYGIVRNPWNPQHSPGGSSGGSGVAVATRMAFMAMGSDTGGSIRIPAAFCGLAGLKPTYGRVSRFGAMPLSWSLDHIGPLARTVRDTAVTLNVIAGRDPRDATTSRRPPIDFVPDDGCSIRGVRIGFPSEFYFDDLDPDVESSVRGAIARANSIGAVVKAVHLPDIETINTVARIILLAEASAMAAPHWAKRDQFGPDVLALLDQGRLLPAVDYVNAQRLRRSLRREFDQIWRDVDCLITPTTPATAPKVGDATVRLGGRDVDVRLAATRLVRAINALGLPALSIPCGLSSTGLPIGMQIVGPAFDEALILRVGAALEDNGVGVPPCPLE